MIRTVISHAANAVLARVGLLLMPRSLVYNMHADTLRATETAARWAARAVAAEAKVECYERAKLDDAIGDLRSAVATARAKRSA